MNTGKRSVKKSKIWEVTKEQLQKLYDDNSYVVDILNEIGVRSSCNARLALKKLCYTLQIDLTKFKENIQNRTGKRKYRKTDRNIFVENCDYIENRVLKSKLLVMGVEYKCKECGIFEYNNRHLVLQLDHINGINNDNRLENLRLLCPNCHSQTDTFCRGVSRKSRFLLEKKLMREKINKCSCGGDKSEKSKLCMKCYKKRIGALGKEDIPKIKEMLSRLSVTEVARELGKAVRTVNFFKAYYL